MSQEKKSSTRQITKGFLGGIEFGFILYMISLLIKVAVNTVAHATVLPDGFEIGGFAIGFSGGIVKSLE
jgi:hypothetical protein